MPITLLKKKIIYRSEALPTEHSNNYSFSYAQHWEIVVSMCYIMTILNILKYQIGGKNIQKMYAVVSFEIEMMCPAAALSQH